MRYEILLIGAVALSAACSSGTARGAGYPNPDVVIVDEDARTRRDGGREGGDVYARSPGEVPPGHYPPPGECRIWYSNRPPGHQPPPARCESLVGRVPRGAFLLYHDRAWDTEYDWRREAARRPGTVPEIVLRIMSSLVQD